VPESFGVFGAVSRTYENLVPLVPSHGTKVKPYVARCVGVLLSFVPKRKK
jgi:hypothetical protein